MRQVHVPPLPEQDARSSGGYQKGFHHAGRRDIDEYDPVVLRRRVGMVFQKPNPFPTMSIFDNVAAGLRLNGMVKKNSLAETVERSLRQAALFDEVKDILDRSGISLSGGQQQRPVSHAPLLLTLRSF